MNIVIYSKEILVFRDGRPFGDAGHVNGGILNWPWPTTITGMLRSRIGLSRDENMFQTREDSPDLLEPERVEKLKKITAERVLPMWQEKGNETPWHSLFPAPADALVYTVPGENMYTVNGFDYEDPFDQGGINLPWQNWRIPVTTAVTKPAADSPDLWYQEHFFAWLATGKLESEIAAKDLGLSYPKPEVRMHTAIDPGTGVVKKGNLFSSQGINLSTVDGDRQKAGRMGIGVELTKTEVGDDPFGPCFFGAERKTAFVDQMKESFPPCLDCFENKKFLRLLLISPGDFGSWAPEWLMPDDGEKETGWCLVPNTDISIRLCSAFIPPWLPVSGWDYAVRRPKATRRLVPAGAVYVIEVKDSSRSQELARRIWGRSMANGLSDSNGCGAVCVGNIDL